MLFILRSKTHHSPNFLELAVAKIWILIKDNEELRLYFLTLENNQLPEKTTSGTFCIVFSQIQKVRWYKMHIRKEVYQMTSKATILLKFRGHACKSKQLKIQKSKYDYLNLDYLILLFRTQKKDLI